MSMNEKYPLALPEGTILAGQYTIEKVLGQGGFGITYKAKDYKTNQSVAVKEFFPDTLAYREMTTVISYPGERTDSFVYGKESCHRLTRTRNQRPRRGKTTHRKSLPYHLYILKRSWR